MRRNALIQTIKIYSCCWCERREEITIDPEYTMRMPEHYFEDPCSRMPLLCSTDCKAEYEESNQQAVAKSMAKHGWPKEGERWIELDKYIEELRQRKLLERVAKWL